MRTYTNFQVLTQAVPNLADELLTSFECGNWQNSSITVWKSLAEFYRCEVLRGQHNNVHHQNNLAFVDKLLAESRDYERCYARIDDQVIKVSHPWYD